jgi:hypothetical protein
LRTGSVAKYIRYEEQKQNEKKNLYSSCLRVGRVSGPYGHAGGRTIEEVRNMVTSQNVKNAIPRTKSAAILIPYHAVKQTNTASEFIPYYIGVRNEKIRVVQPRLNGVPRLGWIVNNKHIMAKINPKVRGTEKNNVANYEDILRTEVSTLFSGAHVLAQLFARYPELQSGESTVDNMVQLYNDISQRTKANTTVLDELLENGRCSVVMEPVFGHLDSYNGKNTTQDDKTLQSKFVLKSGPKSEDKLSTYMECGRIPPGALAYPRYKVYTIARAMKDIEMHSLDNTVHLSSRYRSGSNNYRGGWAQNHQTSEMEYYPECGAMTRLVDLKGN